MAAVTGVLSGTENLKLAAAPANQFQLSSKHAGAGPRVGALTSRSRVTVTGRGSDITRLCFSLRLFGDPGACYHSTTTTQVERSPARGPLEPSAAAARPPTVAVPGTRAGLPPRGPVARASCDAGAASRRRRPRRGLTEPECRSHVPVTRTPSRPGTGPPMALASCFRRTGPGRTQACQLRLNLL